MLAVIKDLVLVQMIASLVGHVKPLALCQLKGNAKEPTILKIVTNVDPDDVVKFQGGLRQCLHRSPATGFTLAYPAKNGRVYVVMQSSRRGSQ